MAYVDKVKEEIGWLKVVFAILLATDIFLVAWLVQNYGSVKLFLLIVGLIGAFLVTFIIVWVNRVARRKINKLEEL